MGRTPKGVTQVCVLRLLALGWTKWRLAFKVKWSEKKSGDRQTWQTIDAWSKGKWEANSHNIKILQDLLFEECRKQSKWYFEPDGAIPHPKENKHIDSNKK